MATNKPPKFGNILAQYIHLVKTNKRGIISHTRLMKFSENLGIDLDLHFCSNFDLDSGLDLTEKCHEAISEICLLLLQGVGIIFSKVPTIRHNCTHVEHLIKDIDDKTIITPTMWDNIDKKGRGYISILFQDMANFDIFLGHGGTHVYADHNINNYFMGELSRLNNAVYGENGDELLNHIISKCNSLMSLLLEPHKYIQKQEHNNLKQSILSKIKRMTPLEFEFFSINLIKHTLEKEMPLAKITASHTGKTNDGGIDGVFQIEQPLTNQQYAIQCKLYSSNIAVGQIRDFFGAMVGKYDQGYFITNHDFAKPCKEFAEERKNLILINGEKITELMIAHKFCLDERHIKAELILNESALKKSLKLP